MFQSYPKGLSLTLIGTVFVLAVTAFFYAGCKKNSSKGGPPGANNPTQPGDPKSDSDLTIITAKEVNDDNVENFKVSGECVNTTDGGGDVTLTVAGRRFTTPCRNGFYTFVLDLTQLNLPDPVIVRISQRVNGVAVSESRQVPQGYRTDDPPPENPVVSTVMELIHPEASPSDVANPVIRVNNRFVGDNVKLYTNRQCTASSQLGNEADGITVGEPTEDELAADPEAGTYAKFALTPMTRVSIGFMTFRLTPMEQQLVMWAPWSMTFYPALGLQSLHGYYWSQTPNVLTRA